MNKATLWVPGAVALACAGCGGNNTESAVQAPGTDTTARTDVLEAGAALLQDKGPLEALDAYMDGFHFYNGNMKGQMKTHHYCALLNEDVTQCVIFDGNQKDAKIMGVELPNRNSCGRSPAPTARHGTPGIRTRTKNFLWGRRC